MQCQCDKYVFACIFCDDIHQCSIPALDKCDKLTTPKKQMLIHSFIRNNITTILNIKIFIHAHKRRQGAFATWSVVKQYQHLLLLAQFVTVTMSQCTLMSLTHYGRVTQICVCTLQRCKTGDANLRF
jgi:hypothetical protein